MAGEIRHLGISYKLQLDKLPKARMKALHLPTELVTLESEKGLEQLSAGAGFAAAPGTTTT